MKKLIIVFVICLALFGLAACQTGHSHTFAEEWSSDETYHWHKATCEHDDLMSKYGEHTFSNGVCTVCGRPSAEHEHTLSEWKSDGDYHWQETTCTSHEVQIVNKGTHTYKAAYCTKCNRYMEHDHVYRDGKCAICGEVEPPHVHNVDTEWHYDDDFHWHPTLCTNHEVQKLDKARHTFENGKCTACKKSEFLTEADVAGTYYAISVTSGSTEYSVNTESFLLLSPDGTGTFMYGEAIPVTYTLEENYVSVEVPNGEETALLYCYARNGSLVSKGGMYFCKEGVDPFYVYDNILYGPGLDGNLAVAIASYSVNQAEIKESIDDVPVTSINYGAFANCMLLQSVNLPSTITMIDDMAFYGCANLGQISLPEDLEYIGNNAFTNCSNIVSITIPEKVTAITAGTFSGCLKLATVTIGAGVETIGQGAFYRCSALKTINIPGNVKTIGYQAFYNCSALQTITFNSGLTTINEAAFSFCNELTSLAFPDTLETIYPLSFGGCYKLESITVATGNSTFSVKNNCLIETATGKIVKGCLNSTIPNDGTIKIIGASAFTNFITTESLVIPEGVTSIEEQAFSMCGKLTSVTLPNSLSSIGEAAFAQCGLLSVELPELITEIANDAFAYNAQLASVTINGQITKIGERAFAGCTSLKSITLPASLTAIGYEAFRACEGIAIEFLGTREAWDAIPKFEEEKNDRGQSLFVFSNTTDHTVHCSDDAI